MATIKIKYTDNYTLNIVGASFLSMVCLVGATYSNYFLFGLFLPILILASDNGLEIDQANKQYRDYKSFFGASRGKWKSLDDYSNIVIQSKSGSKSVLGMRLTAEIKIKVVINTVYLMDEHHMKKLFLKSFQQYDLAKTFAENISVQLNFPIATFNPLSARNRGTERR